jgi:tRNA (adenine57-N1/adenine58-N1)-methyltransferase
MRPPFEAGERALLIDRRGRRYLITLRANKTYHTHAGSIEHDDVIGAAEGLRLTTTGGAGMVAIRPSLADFILKMPRGAQVVYPKDIAAIVMWADIYPGASVLEAGTGSGALTLGLLRAVSERGRVISYDVREDHAAKARANIESFLGKVPDALEMRLADVTEGVPETGLDRAVFDMPEPWRAVPVALGALRPGGIVCSYVPTVPQVQKVTEAFVAGGFIDILTTETIVRPWRVEGLSVRPDHRMVAHTGFITVARTLGSD